MSFANNPMETNSYTVTVRFKIQNAKKIYSILPLSGGDTARNRAKISQIFECVPPSLCKHFRVTQRGLITIGSRWFDAHFKAHIHRGGCKLAKLSLNFNLR